VTPLVSVIVVSYRTRDLTLRCLTELRKACTSVPYETIVVDNASGDGSAEAVAAAFPTAEVVRLEQNVGFGRAVNEGAARAKGRWLLLVNPDTVPRTDVIGALVAAAYRDPAAGIYTGRTLREDGTDDGRSCFGLPTLWSLSCFATGLSTVFRRSRLWNPEELPTLDRSSPATVPAVSGCLVLLDRELFAGLGGFTPDYFMYSEDIDLSARAWEQGARPAYVPAAQVVHLGGASSTSVSKRVMVLRGKCTYLRLRWSPRRAAVGRAMLATGIALRAAGSRLTGRARYWREVWAQRRTWLAGWPPVPGAPRLRPTATSPEAPEPVSTSPEAPEPVSNSPQETNLRAGQHHAGTGATP
jgi:N-acetylglucosaminyl-diphospho-decaprenol L-rhamnosyltransferase